MLLSVDFCVEHMISSSFEGCVADPTDHRQLQDKAGHKTILFAW